MAVSNEVAILTFQEYTGGTLGVISATDSSGARVSIGNPKFYAFKRGDSFVVRRKNGVLVVSDKQGYTKYFRARVSSKGGADFKGFRMLDSASYTNSEKFIRDIRANGYGVSLVVQITKSFELNAIVFERGTYLH